MWTPDHFAWTKEEELRALIAAHGFGLLVSHGPGGMQASHLPLVLEDDLLLGHVARPNPHAAAFDGKTPALAIFQGAHGYISPRWYTSRDNVPTWNYEAVHLEGTIRAVSDPARARDILTKLTRPYEAGADQPWSLDDLAPSKLDGLLRGIIPFEMIITRWTGKRKMSQNRKQEDAAGALAALESSARPDDRELALAMRRTLAAEKG